MVQILLVAHAPLASAFRAVAQHAFPDCACRLLAVDVSAQDGLEHSEQVIRVALRSLLDVPATAPSAPVGAGTGAAATAAAAQREVLILVDAFGATPCNAALAAADGFPARVVAGISVPMLWRVLCYPEKTLDELVESAVAGAAQGALHASVSRRQNQAPQSVKPHDSQSDHHQ